MELLSLWICNLWALCFFSTLQAVPPHTGHVFCVRAAAVQWFSLVCHHHHCHHLPVSWCGEEGLLQTSAANQHTEESGNAQRPGRNSSRGFSLSKWGQFNYSLWIQKRVNLLFTCYRLTSRFVLVSQVLLAARLIFTVFLTHWLTAGPANVKVSFFRSIQNHWESRLMQRNLQKGW